MSFRLLRASRSLLRIDDAYLLANLCFEIFHVDSRCGFAAVTETDGEKYLDHLWIDPSTQNRGAGKFALAEIEDLARRRNWSRLLVLPDPDAEGFYIKCGFVDTGTRRPSRVSGGPEFGLFRRDFDDQELR